MKYRLIFTTIVITVSILCVGCKDEKVSETAQETSYVLPTNTEEEQDEQEDEIVYPTVEPESTKQLRLRTDVSDEYRDVTLKLGEKVDVPNRQGYRFIGYQDKKNEDGVTYIDENGVYTMEYHGTELLVLWPKFEPIEYCITICEEGIPLKEASKLICKFDENITDDLPWGKEIIKDRKADDRESYVITGFEVEGGQYGITDASQKLLLKKLQDYANHDERTLSLDVLTTDITYLWNNLNTREVSNRGFLKQEATSKNQAYDYFSISEDIDLEKLIGLGFKKVKFELTISKNHKEKNDGIPRVIIAKDIAEKEKDFKELTLFDTGKIKDDFYKINDEIPIEQLTGEFYIYYNSEKIGKNSWDCTGLTLELKFER